MPFTVRTDKEFAGPTLHDLLPVLDEIPDPVEARWAGTKQDFLAYEHCAARELVLVTPDAIVAERALWLLGGQLALNAEDLAAAKLALTNRKDQTWRLRVEDLGLSRGTLLLTTVVGDSLRSGKAPRAAASIARDCVLDRVHPADADVLLRLRVGNPALCMSPA